MSHYFTLLLYLTATVSAQRKSAALIVGGHWPSDETPTVLLDSVELYGCPNTDRPIRVSNMPVRSYYMAGIYRNDTNDVLFCGGYQCRDSGCISAASDCFVWNPVEDTWDETVVAPMRTGRWTFLMAHGPNINNANTKTNSGTNTNSKFNFSTNSNNKISANSNSNYSADTNNNTSSNANNNTNVNNNNSNNNTTTTNNNNNNNNNKIRSTWNPIAIGDDEMSEIYDPLTNQWNNHLPIPTWRWHGIDCFYQDHEWDESIYHVDNIITKLDINTWTFEDMGEVPEVIAINLGRCSPVTINGQRGLFVRHGYFFNFITRQWEQKAAPPGEATAPDPNAMWSFRGRPTIFGSPRCNIEGVCKNVAVLQYVPEEDTWIALEELLEPREFHEVVEVPAEFCDFFQH